MELLELARLISSQSAINFYRRVVLRSGATMQDLCWGCSSWSGVCMGFLPRKTKYCNWTLYELQSLFQIIERWYILICNCQSL